MFSKFRRIIRALRTTRISFRILRQAPVVLVYQDGFEVLSKFIDPSLISIIDPSKPNFWVVLKCLVSRKHGLNSYTAEVIKAQNPIVVITFIDNDTSFYFLKSLTPAPLYIAIQNGIRNNYAYSHREGFVDHLEKSGGKDQLTADIICTFGESSSIFFERFIQSRTLVTGNLKNNLMKIANPIEPQYDIVFVSQHAPFDLARCEETMFLNEVSISLNDFYEIERSVSKFLAQFCSDNSLHFAVSGKRGAEDVFERQFFEEAIGEIPFTFLPRTDAYSSYENCINSRVVVVIDSTIGYELLSRGKKVAFFSARLFNPLIDQRELEDSFFGYPGTYPVEGPFWTNKPNHNEYVRILDSLLRMTDTEWAAEIRPYTEDLMAYRPDNKEFIQMLHDQGIQTRNEDSRRA
jgi:surface carbohydrate biosynthesis protein